MNTTQSTTIQLLIFLVIIVWRLVRKMRERPIKSDRQRWRLPVILTAVGVAETAALTNGAHRIHFSTADVAYLVLVSAFSLGMGLVRGTTIRIGRRGGLLTQQYTKLTAALWVATIAARAALDLGSSHAFGVAAAVTGTSVLMMFGLSLLGESACVALRTGAGPLPSVSRP